MKKKLLVLLFLTSIFSFSQEKKIQYGIQLFPNFSTGIPEKDGEKAEYYQGAETFVFAYSAGFEFDWNFAEKWTLSTGILYKEVGERGKVIPADPYRGFIYPHRHRLTLSSIELPINLSRNLGEHFLVEFGMSPVLTIRAKSGDDRYSKGHMNPQFRNPVGLCANLGFGFQTKFSNCNLKIIPYAQMCLLTGIYEFYYLWPSMRFFSGGIKIAVVI